MDIRNPNTGVKDASGGVGEDVTGCQAALESRKEGKIPKKIDDMLRRSEKTRKMIGDIGVKADIPKYWFNNLHYIYYLKGALLFNQCFRIS